MIPTGPYLPPLAANTTPNITARVASGNPPVAPGPGPAARADPGLPTERGATVCSLSRPRVRS